MTLREGVYIWHDYKTIALNIFDIYRMLPKYKPEPYYQLKCQNQKETNFITHNSHITPTNYMNFWMLVYYKHMPPFMLLPKKISNLLLYAIQ